MTEPVPAPAPPTVDAPSTKQSHWERWVAVISLLGTIASLVYARQQVNLAHRQLQQERRDKLDAIVRDATQEITRGRTTVPQNEWLLSGTSQATLVRAIEKLTAVIESDGSRPEAFNFRGIGHSTLGQYEKAKADFRKAAELWKGLERARALNNLGDAFLRECNFGEAEKYFRLALDVNSKYAVARANLADTYRRQLRLKEAEREVDQALADDGTFVGNYIVKGRIALTRNDLRAAMRSFSRAVELDPDYQAESHLELSRVLMRMDRSRIALKHAVNAAAIDRTSAEAQRWLAVCLRRENDLEAADDAERRAEALESSRVNRLRCP